MTEPEHLNARRHSVHVARCMRCRLVSRHLIRFAREAASGSMNASYYSAKLRDPLQIAAE
jgi:hypothetical protein